MSIENKIGEMDHEDNSASRRIALQDFPEIYRAGDFARIIFDFYVPSEQKIYESKKPPARIPTVQKIYIASHGNVQLIRLPEEPKQLRLF